MAGKQPTVQADSVPTVAFSKVASTCDVLPSDSILYVTCINLEAHLWKLPSCPAFGVFLHEGHIAFSSKLENRRLVFFTREDVGRISTRSCPVWLKVKSSCEIQIFNPDEDETDGPYHAVLVSDFEEIPSAAGPLVKLQVPPEDKPYEMPPITHEYTCNCVMLPIGGNLVISDDHHLEPVISPLVDTEARLGDLQIREEVFTLKLGIKGSPWDQVYQDALKSVRGVLGTTGMPVNVSVVHEHENQMDINALAIMYQDLKLGYIGGVHIPRVTKALGDESFCCKLTSVSSYFYKEKRVYQGSLVLSKSTEWGNVCSNYMYNQTL